MSRNLPSVPPKKHSPSLLVDAMVYLAAAPIITLSILSALLASDWNVSWKRPETVVFTLFLSWILTHVVVSTLDPQKKKRYRTKAPKRLVEGMPPPDPLSETIQSKFREAALRTSYENNSLRDRKRPWQTRVRRRSFETHTRIVTDSTITSAIVEGDCPYCGSTLSEGTIAQCFRCDTHHHEDCWIEGDGCTTYSCGEKKALRPT